MKLGYALDTKRERIKEINLPPDILKQHYARFATTGYGKTKAKINDVLSLHETTRGPIIIIDPKGESMAENYMRAHMHRFGKQDLLENVIYFDIPNVLPGFAPFNIENSLQSTSKKRENIIKSREEYYEEILRIVMGNQYDEAVAAGNLIKYIIKVLYDEEKGLENGRYRQSINYFSHRHIEDLISDLRDIDPKADSSSRVTNILQTSDPQIRNKIDQYLQSTSKTLSNILTGVMTRTDYITQEDNLKQVFNNTCPTFDFRDHIDSSKVIIFSLGDLRKKAAKTLTGLILTQIYDVVKENKRKTKPDDYVVNLIIDEASSVAVSQILNDMLEKGRGFDLGIGLLMQYPEQMKEQADNQAYMNLLGNVNTLLVGKVPPDDKLAEEMAHESMTPNEFKKRISTLKKGEWITKLPSPGHGESYLKPFYLEPLEIPPGDLDSDISINETKFRDVLDQIRQKTRKNYSIPEEGRPILVEAPRSVQKKLEVDTGEIDNLLANCIRKKQIQLRSQSPSPDQNPYVKLSEPVSLLWQMYERADESPDIDSTTMTRIITGSPLIDIDTDTSSENESPRVRLTDRGKQVTEFDTGDVQSSGSEEHDEGIRKIQNLLSKVGFTVSPVEQDRSSQPDARAFHPKSEHEFNIEFEKTSLDNPVKVLTNLARAQEDDVIPIFVVDRGDKSNITKWAIRIENILSEPIKKKESGGSTSRYIYYTDSGSITFNGGANTRNGYTAARRYEGESRRTVWIREDNSETNTTEYVLEHPDGTELERLQENPLHAPKERYPARYTYNRTSGEYTVYDQGQRHVYNSREEFRDEWVSVKKPFMPEESLPALEYDSNNYAIVILSGEDSETTEPLLYENGGTYPLDYIEDLIEEGDIYPASEYDTPTESELDEYYDTGYEAEHDKHDDKNTTAENEKEDITSTSTQTYVLSKIYDDEEKFYKDFAEECFVESEGNYLPTSEVYDVYQTISQNHDIDETTSSWFSRKLNKYSDKEMEKEIVKVDGESKRCYLNQDLSDEVRSYVKRMNDDG